MELFRICAAQHAEELIASGIANRWNRQGQMVIYAGSSRSLSTLELIVHRNAITSDATYKVMVISVADDDRLIRQIYTHDLPENWQTFAAYSTLQQIGAGWYNTQESLLLKVPSAIVPFEYNFVINTEHPDFHTHLKLIRTEDYFWDRRLL